MRLAIVLMCMLPSLATAEAPRPPASTDMGAWDCNGSPTREVAIDPGDTTYVWRGECSGAEGFDVVVEPASKDLASKMHYDGKTKELSLRVTNRSKAIVRVKMHVFVGFA